MSSASKKAKPVARALPTIRKPKRTDATRVAVTRTTVTTMQGSSLYTGSPVLQAAAAAWNQAADAVESNAKVCSDLRSKLAVAEAAQRGFRRDWADATKHVMSTATITCQGSPDHVHELGFDVLTHAGPGPVTAPALTVEQGKLSGEAIVGWAKGNARHGYIVQHAVDPSNPATVSPAIPCTRTKYKLEGAPPASVVHFRVAAIDPSSPTGQSPWTDWVTATVR